MNTSPCRTTAAQQRRPDAWGWRRQRAWELHQQGWWQKGIAAALGVSRAAVCQWLNRRREGGAEALRTRPLPGRAPRLTAEQCVQLLTLLARGAEAYGFRGDVWTARWVADVLWRTFGVHYHPDNVGRLLRRIGWSWQQPVQRPTQRDEAAIQQWYTGRWPVLQKRRGRKGASLSGVDESAFYLLPHAVRSWAPRRQTPILRMKLSHDHLAAISGITLDGRLFLQLREQTFDRCGRGGLPARVAPQGAW